MGSETGDWDAKMVLPSVSGTGNRTSGLLAGDGTEEAAIADGTIA
ncbi:MAG: hypothetical protein VB027_09555 [Gordonibacter sp.]|nr:hypothetical protein [Gordonibacter sp.]